MREAFSKILKHSSIYGIGNFATKGITIILIPLYTTYLTPSDYGILQICNIFHTILTIVLMFGMSSSLFRVYYNINDHNERNIVFSSTIITYIVLAGSIILLLLTFSEPLSKVVIGNEGNGYLFRIVVLAAFMEGFYNLLLAYFRAEEKPILYSISIFVRVLFYLSLNILFVATLKRNYLGVREVNLISIVLISMLVIPFTLKNLKFKIKFCYIKEVLEIGIPLGLGGIAIWILGLTDRYMLKFLLPEQIALTQVGLYSLGAKLAMIIRFILVGPFMISWGVLMFSYQNDIRAKEIYASVLKYFVFLGGILFFILSLFSKEVIMILVSNNLYHLAYKIVPFLSLSIILHGVYQVFSVGVTLTKKTKYVIYSNYSAAISNIGLNFVLIPKYGMFGAAFASVIAYTINVIIIYCFAQKVYHINYKIVKVIVYLIVLCTIIFLSNYYDVNTLFKVIICILVILIAPSLGLVNYSQINSGFKMIYGKIIK
jgi:O-antigen/teichoic acid export membrane protein